MKTITIILILLFIFFIILNIYYVFNVKNNEIVNRMNIEKFNGLGKPFLNTYIDEPLDINNATFVPCNGNANCTTTMDQLYSQNNVFLNRVSQYNNDYKYKSITDMNSEYRKYNDIMNVSSLLAYRCVNISPQNMSKLLLQNNDKFAHIYKRIFIYSESSLNDYIYDQIQKIKNNTNCNIFNENNIGGSVYNNKYCSTNLTIDFQKNKGTNKIIGPVYVLVSQSPYLERDGKMLNARSDIVHNKLPYFKERTVNGVIVKNSSTSSGSNTDSMTSLYAEVLIIFPMYEMENKPDALAKMTLTTDINRLAFFDSMLSSKFVHQELCYMKCNKGSLFCGCLNATENEMNFSEDIPYHKRPYIENINGQNANIIKYNSKCVNNSNKPTDYSMLYFINPYSRFKDLIMNINR